MNEINEIVLSLAEYKNLDTLYCKVGEHVKLLLEAGNVVTVFPSGNKLTEIIIQFTSLDDKSPKPYWLFDDEASYVSKYHLSKELDYHKHMVNIIETAQDNDDLLSEADSDDDYDA